MTNVEYPMVIKTVSDDDGGGYIAFSPDLKGCMADGESPEEAVTNLKDAIQEWIDEAVRLGREVPKPSSAALAAGRERQIMKQLIAKQDEVLNLQSEAISELTSELSSLRQQIDELTSQVDYPSQLWEQSLAVPARIVGLLNEKTYQN